MQSTWVAQLMKTHGNEGAGPTGPRTPSPRRSGLKVAVATVAIMLIGVFVVQTASASPYYLGAGYAKEKSKSYALNVCSRYAGCIRYRVPLCQRRSDSRVDCLSVYQFSDGAVCGMVITNRANSYGKLIQGEKKARCR